MTPTPNGQPLLLLPPSFDEREGRAADKFQDEFEEYLDPDGCHDDAGRVLAAYGEWRGVRAERAVAALRDWFSSDPRGLELAHVLIDDQHIRKPP